ncbi:hypothetical protein NW752_000229 [Fusarium irregulare]|uniref:Uncharacterized protein n=1 Tax=Fusarium irregulare TaxID=2494466 RepID=A0A9W8PZ67_9HYPO|nr:hypothetical protein NW766_001605 [Fusarium irregulare]KAJ4027976.1 hypothetical protein NW752_000229 [Fusarium irregulare]
MKLQGITSSAMVSYVVPAFDGLTWTSTGTLAVRHFHRDWIPNFDTGKVVQWNRTKFNKSKMRDQATYIVTRNGSAEMAHTWLLPPHSPHLLTFPLFRRPSEQRLFFKLRAVFLAVNTMDNGGLQWLSPETSMANLIYTTPMNFSSNGRVSIMQGIFVVELRHNGRRRPRRVKYPFPTVESTESTVATVLVTEGSPFVEDRFDLDRCRRPNDSLGSTRNVPVPEWNSRNVLSLWN